VKRVVNLFEVLSDEEMKRIDAKAVAPANTTAPAK